MNMTDLKSKFIEVFGGTEEGLRVFSAPGRVNLIGEHTDYNGGFVLPAALSLSSTVLARPRLDRQLCLYASDLRRRVDAGLDALEGKSRLEWGSYQLAVASELKKAGRPLSGCDLLYYDTVPFGAGLSSSAAIEVVTAYALSALAVGPESSVKDIDLTALAKLCQKAENDYIGVACGIMDQFASAMGKKDHALFLNCKSLAYAHVPLRLDGYRLVITNTNKKRSLYDSKYNERRTECGLGLEILRRSLLEADCLGDISWAQYTQYADTIRDAVIRKRVAHVISEDDRVLSAIEALRHNDLTAFGRLMTASHESLRTLYEVTGPELDTLVTEALRIDGVLGSRMTGAGFGGCTVSIVKTGAVDDFMHIVGDRYRKKTGLTASFYIAETGDGVREVR